MSSSLLGVAFLLALSGADGGTRSDNDTVFHELPSGSIVRGFTGPSSFAPLIRMVRAGVVNVAASKGSTAAVASRGSGFIIDEAGSVLTNAHVVKGASTVRVRLTDGRDFNAVVIGVDASTDVALLRIDPRPKESLPYVYLGDSDSLEVGDWVLAIGNPFGLEHSVAHGMISAKERALGMSTFDDFLQTDTLINPGNSGGPLFNMSGGVVGVNTAIMEQGQGIGFAIPINMVKDILPNLRGNAAAARGWLGVNVQRHLSDEGVEHVVIEDVYRDSPAAKAGIRPGDVLTGLNGHPISSYLVALRHIALEHPGESVRLSLLRDGRARETALVLGEKPAPDALELIQSAGHLDDFGLVVHDLDDAAKKRYRLGSASGAVITAVVPGSGAERAGLLAGDRLVLANGAAVTSMTKLVNLARGLSGAPLQLRFDREGRVGDVTLQPGGR